MGFEEHAVRSLQDRLQCSSTSELVEQLVAAGVGPGTTATQPAVVQAYPVGGATGVVANPMLAADVQLEREEPQLFRLNSSTGIMCARLCSFFYLDRPMEKAFDVLQGAGWRCIDGVRGRRVAQYTRGNGIVQKGCENKNDFIVTTQTLHRISARPWSACPGRSSLPPHRNHNLPRGRPARMPPRPRGLPEPARRSRPPCPSAEAVQPGRRHQGLLRGASGSLRRPAR